jgi:hypothetical protein
LICNRFQKGSDAVDNGNRAVRSLTRRARNQTALGLARRDFGEINAAIVQ